ncbi:MAG TPA: nucleoside 2-deoxyribosyltransferase [Anaerolineaceae bacterium]|nr:nucleoside 2-deoxyribosyltransferase [Anaerolineaceae bacterium]
MNVYFSCSITGGRAEEAVYQEIVKELEALGHDVPTAHLSSPQVMEMEKVVDPVEIYERDMAWLRECDAVVAEVSSPSHGVGYEIAYALSLGKPVLCCFKAGKKVSKIITGNTSPGLTVAVYAREEDAPGVVREFIQELSDHKDH